MVQNLSHPSSNCTQGDTITLLLSRTFNHWTSQFCNKRGQYHYHGFIRVLCRGEVTCSRSPNSLVRAELRSCEFQSSALSSKKPWLCWSLRSPCPWPVLLKRCTGIHINHLPRVTSICSASKSKRDWHIHNLFLYVMDWSLTWDRFSCLFVVSPLQQEFPRLSMQDKNGKLLNNHFYWGNHFFLRKLFTVNPNLQHLQCQKRRLKGDQCTFMFLICLFKNTKIHTAFL